MMESQEKEFRSELRYAYRSGAINMFGKHYTELVPREIRTVLGEINMRYFPLRPYRGATQISKEEFLQLFRKVFRREIQQIRR